MIFSVIVPFFNEEKYIRKCINSLLDQDFNKDEYEIIFIDNGSTDSSNAIAEEFKEVILLHENKTNVYTARNKGLKIAKGEIIAFTDADCAVSKDWLSQIYEKMNKTGATIALGKILFAEDSPYLLRLFERYNNAKIEYTLKKFEKKYYYGYANNMAIKSHIFKEQGMFAEWPVPGDTEIVTRCVSSIPDCKVVYLDQMKVIHLEVSRVTSWFNKLYRDGKHNVLAARIGHYMPLDIKKRLEIYRYVCTKNNYSIQKRIIFVLLMITGYLFYKIGEVRGKIN